MGWSKSFGADVDPEYLAQIIKCANIKKEIWRTHDWKEIKVYKDPFIRMVKEWKCRRCGMTTTKDWECEGTCQAKIMKEDPKTKWNERDRQPV